MLLALAAQPRAHGRRRAAHSAKIALSATLLAGAAMLAIAPAAMAQPAPQGPPPPQPPPISQAEFVNRRVSHLMEADTNHSGRISLSEWMAYRAGKPGAEHAREQFEKLDLNHDGVLTRDELTAFAEKEYARRLEHTATMPPPPPPGPN